MRQTRHLVGLFFVGQAFFQVLELQVAGDFGEDCESEWVPRRQQLILSNEVAVFDENVSAINDLIASNFAAALVDDR